MMYLCASAGSARWLTYGLPAPYSCPLELRELKLIHSANGSSNLWLELHAEVTAFQTQLMQCNRSTGQRGDEGGEYVGARALS